MNVFEAMFSWRHSDRPMDSVSSLMDASAGAFAGMEVQADRATAESGYYEQAATTAQLSAAIQALQSSQSNQQLGGISGVVTFTDRANSSGLGADFDQYYSGAGTGDLGIVDGRAALIPVSDDDRVCNAIFNVTPTASDFQMVGGAFSSAPMAFLGSADKSYNRLIVRSSADGGTFVFAELSKYEARLRCIIDGDPPLTLASRTSGFSFKSNSLYWVQAGDVGGEIGFHILEGTIPVLDYTDTLADTLWGDTYRHFGLGADWQASAAGSLPFGSMTAFAYADNVQQPITGSDAEMYRADAGFVGISSGANPLPADYFDNVRFSSQDIHPNLSAGTFTVDESARYLIHWQNKMNNMTNRFIPRLWIDGVADKKFGMQVAFQDSGVGSAAIPDCMSASVPVYLNAGETVGVGTDALGPTSSALTGGAGGYDTYVSITRIGARGL